MGVGGRSLSVLTSLCSACSRFSRAPLYYIIFWPATCNSERRVPVSTLIHLASVELPASSYPNHAKRVSQSEVQSCRHVWLPRCASSSIMCVSRHHIFASRFVQTGKRPDRQMARLQILGVCLRRCELCVHGAEGNLERYTSYTCV